MAPEEQENSRKCPAIVNEPTFLQIQDVYTENENETDDERELISIKEMMARLDGVFPMDEAVIDGKLQS